MPDFSDYTAGERADAMALMDSNLETAGVYSYAGHGYDAWTVDRLCELLRLREMLKEGPTQLKRYDLERISAGYAGTDHEMQEWLTGEWIKWDDLASWLKKAQEAL